MSTYEVPSEVREAFLHLFDEADATDETILDAYAGEHASDEDFAEDLLAGTDVLDDMPEDLLPYFDYEKYAHDLMCDDFVKHGRHYFYRNW